MLYPKEPVQMKMSIASTG